MKVQVQDGELVVVLPPGESARFGPDELGRAVAFYGALGSAIREIAQRQRQRSTGPVVAIEEALAGRGVGNAQS